MKAYKSDLAKEIYRKCIEDLDFGVEFRKAVDTGGEFTYNGVLYKVRFIPINGDK